MRRFGCCLELEINQGSTRPASFWARDKLSLNRQRTCIRDTKADIHNTNDLFLDTAHYAKQIGSSVQCDFEVSPFSELGNVSMTFVGQVSTLEGSAQSPGFEIDLEDLVLIECKEIARQQPEHRER